MIFNTSLARENWVTKYQYRDETELETFQRVARALACVEKNYGATDAEVELWYDKFLKTLVKFEVVDSDRAGEDIYVDQEGRTLQAVGLKCTPGGRITANAGTEYKNATLLNCFISYGITGAEITYTRETPDGAYKIPVKLTGNPDTPDDLTNIMVSLTQQAKTLSNEGGYGVNFDFIRPRGSLIKGTGVRHPGVIAYMEVWDKVADMIVRGDTDGYHDHIEDHLPQAEKVMEALEKSMPRKGAQMGCLSVWHPDIEEFIRVKQTKGRLTKFNLSVVVDDAFMQAVENDTLYDLHFEGVVHKRVRARELYDLMMTSTYNRNEPGILFEGNMNRANPIEYMGRVNATNPCLAAGTLVATEKGLVPVEQIEVGDRIQTTLGFAPVKTIEVHRDYPVYKVTFSDGTVLRATEGHIFHTMVGGRNTEARKRWDRETRLKDLEVGTYVRKAPYRHIPENRHDLTRNDGFLAGYWLGDGSRSERDRLILAANLSEDNTFLEQALDEAGLVYHLDESSEGDGCNYRIQSKLAAAFFEKVGLSPVMYSQEKTAPSWWLNTNRDFLAGVLDGLISSDGNVNLTSRYPSIRFKSTSHGLHDLFREICLYAGASYKLYKAGEAGEVREIYGREVVRKNDVYEGHLTNDCIAAVYDFTQGLSHPTKAEALREVIRTRNLTGTRWKVKVESIEPDGTADVYDLYEPLADDWNTHGIVSRGCGEIGGNPWITTVCLLGSLNLTMYIRKDRTFDWEAYAEDVQTFGRMLENVNDIGNVPLPEYQWALENVRQYGMGINGLGSAHYMLGLTYGSEDSLEFVARVNRVKENLTWKTSALLAQERGPAPAFSEKFYETDWFTEFADLDDEVIALMRAHGVRNLKTTTNPPLGNSSVICDSVSNGIEPVFSYGYERTVITDKWPEGLTQENVKGILSEIQVGDATAWRGDYAGRTWYYEPHNRGLCFVEPVRDFGYNWVLTHYPVDIEEGAEYLVTAQELPVRTHVDVQAKVQQHLNQSVSKTSNLPKEYPYEDFKGLYLDAWKRGLNGFTTYREGTMEAVLATSFESSFVAEYGNLFKSLVHANCTPQDADVTDEGVVIRHVKLPDVFHNGPTHQIRREGSKFYFHLSYLPEDAVNPIAFWIHSNDYQKGEYVTLNRAFRHIVKLLLEKGVDHDLVLDQVDKISQDAYHVKLGKIISMALRHAIPMVEIVNALTGIDGDYVSTTLTAVRKFLSGHIEDGVKAVGIVCEACGSDDVIFESGCSLCRSCGASGC